MGGATRQDQLAKLPLANWLSTSNHQGPTPNESSALSTLAITRDAHIVRTCFGARSHAAIAGEVKNIFFFFKFAHKND